MSWEKARSRFAEKSRPNWLTRPPFENQHPFAIGIEDEIAHLDEDTYHAVKRDEYQQTLLDLDAEAVDGNIDEIKLEFEDDSPWNDVPAKAKITGDIADKVADNTGNGFADVYEGIDAEISFDLSNELEKASGVNFALVDAHSEREALDQLKLDAIPDGTALYRLGHAYGFIFPDEDDFYTHAQFEDDPDFPSLEEADEYMTQKRRYVDHLKSHGAKVMAIGGTDSIQVTMRPHIEEVENGNREALFGDGYEVDDLFREFFGTGGDANVSMPAISPVLYAPFMNSPVLEEADDGEDVYELVDHMGREWAYAFSFERSDYVDSDGMKFGYIPEFAQVEGLEDAIDFYGDKIFQFTDELAADELAVVGEDDETLYSMYGDEHDHIEADTPYNVRFGHDASGTKTFKEFMESRKIEGIATLPGAGDGTTVKVEKDYNELIENGEMTEDEFYDEAWGHFIAHSTGVWPSFRPRFNNGAVESRDFGNSYRIQEAIDTQAAAFVKWPEIQDYMADVHEMHDGYANILRSDVSNAKNETYADSTAEYDVDTADMLDYLSGGGLDTVLPSGHTIRDAWYGPDGEDGLLDVLEDGVREMSYGQADVPAEDRDAYAEQWRDQMETYLEDGTPADVFTDAVNEHGKEYAMEQTRVDAEKTYTPPQ